MLGYPAEVANIDRRTTMTTTRVGACMDSFLKYCVTLEIGVLLRAEL
jgi:hypothetical protein